ncbi:MAG TPA: hypothetical protein VJT81_15455 [Burkholderiales bacterium]|nr:hypothetical protein [Burkholderiales bacterium]
MLTLIGIPLLAVLFGLLIVGCFKLGYRNLLIATGTLWVAYGIYEYLMQIRVLCSGECNIRVDLLLIYPVLLALTLASLVRSTIVLWRRRKPRLD